MASDNFFVLSDLVLIHDASQIHGDDNAIIYAC